MDLYRRINEVGGPPFAIGARLEGKLLLLPVAGLCAVPEPRDSRKLVLRIAWESMHPQAERGVCGTATAFFPLCATAE